MLGSWPFQNAVSWGEARNFPAVYHGTLHSNHLSCMLPPFCSESLIITYYLLLLIITYYYLIWISLLLLFRWLNRTIIMAPYLAGLYSNLMLLLVWVLNSFVFHFWRWSVWRGKLLLMCKLCTIFHSALFIFVIQLMLHCLAKSIGFWKSTFLVPWVSFKTKWFFSNLMSLGFISFLSDLGPVDLGRFA